MSRRRYAAKFTHFQLHAMLCHCCLLLALMALSCCLELVCQADLLKVKQIKQQKHEGQQSTAKPSKIARLKTILFDVVHLNHLKHLLLVGVLSLVFHISHLIRPRKCQVGVCRRRRLLERTLHLDMSMPLVLMLVIPKS